MTNDDLMMEVERLMWMLRIEPPPGYAEHLARRSRLLQERSAIPDQEPDALKGYFCSPLRGLSVRPLNSYDRSTDALPLDIYRLYTEETST